MKKLLLTTLFLLAMLVLFAEVLHINTPQQDYEIPLSDIIHIQFEQDVMEISTTTQAYNFPVFDILYIDFVSSTSADSAAPSAVRSLLRQNYPNPFNPNTNISFALTEASEMEIIIYDQKGRLVRTLVQGTYSSGEHTVNWNGRNEIGQMVPSGVYFYRMKTPRASQTRKMIVMK